MRRLHGTDQGVRRQDAADRRASLSGGDRRDHRRRGPGRRRLGLVQHGPAGGLPLDPRRRALEHPGQLRDPCPAGQISGGTRRGSHARTRCDCARRRRPKGCPHRHPRDGYGRSRGGRVRLHRSRRARRAAHGGARAHALARRTGAAGQDPLGGRGRGHEALPLELPRIQEGVLPRRREVGVKYRAVKGTRDLLPPESERFADAEAIARRVFGSYGYAEVRTPCLEATELFARSVGETTDIVHKEMYTFKDRKGRSLTLRPENTAGVVRAVIENGLAAGPMPLRLWYAGPQFRYERPQAGRYREFRQIGAELFGVPGPAAEVETLTMLRDFLEALGFRSLSVSVNSVGTAGSRETFGKALREYLEPRSSGFGDDSRRHHEEVCRLLADVPIPFRDEPSLVRGLDYYTRTVFEVASADLGAQDAILGGGRYDNLVQTLGGPDLPAIGFAIGEDRLLQAAPLPAATRGLLFLLPQGPGDVNDALALASELRAGIGSVVEVDLLARGFKKGMARASALFEESSARGLDREKIFAVFLGAREREEGAVTVKKLASAEQQTVPRGEIVGWFSPLFGAPGQGRP